MSVTPIIPGLTEQENTEPVHKAPVIPLGCVTKLNLDPDLILEANKGKLSGFLLIGFDHDGEEYFAATYSDGGTAMWLLERCKKRLMDW